MSYEGYNEFLCAKGHYLSCDCYETDPETCHICGSKMQWWHPVDQTNGYDETNPSTYSAKIEHDGYDDEWHIDHYENRFATKRFRFKPASDEWRIIRS